MSNKRHVTVNRVSSDTFTPHETLEKLARSSVMYKRQRHESSAETATQSELPATGAASSTSNIPAPFDQPVPKGKRAPRADTTSHTEVPAASVDTRSQVCSSMRMAFLMHNVSRRRRCTGVWCVLHTACMPSSPPTPPRRGRAATHVPSSPRWRTTANSGSSWAMRYVCGTLIVVARTHHAGRVQLSRAHHGGRRACWTAACCGARASLCPAGV